MTFEKVTFDFIDEDGFLLGEPSLAAMYNPAKYTRNKSAQYAEVNIPGLDSPILQYVRGQNEKLSLELFFDTTTMDNSGLGDQAIDVTDYTEPFYQLVKLQGDTHAPPRVLVTWGNGLSFQAVTESVQQEFTLFNAQGTPLRATLTLSLREYRSLEEQLTDPMRSSPDYTKRHEVKRGDTLTLIAFREYRDASQWRLIADHNGLDNPRDLVPGMVLGIPPLQTGR